MPHPEDRQQKPIEYGFSGFGRVPTSDAGSFRFTTVMPGGRARPSGRMQAPHLAITVFMRGLLKQLVTRLYFPNEPANADDPILNLISPERRPTLIANTKESGVLEWDIHLQGRDETVFFDC